MEILLSDKHFHCVIIPFVEWERSMGRLRYDVFVKELGWVKGNKKEGVEIDEYDPSAIHLAVFSSNNSKDILCYMRILEATSSRGMMLTDIKCFKDILPLGFEIPPRAMELSRLCLKPELKRTRDGLRAISLMFRSVLVYMKKNNLDILFAIADGIDERGYSHKDFLVKRFPSFVLIGGALLHPRKETVTYVMSLTAEGLEKDLARR